MTSSSYRGPIAVFGLFLPCVGAAAVIALSYFAKSRMAESLDAKIGHFKSYEQTRQAVLALELDLAPQRPHVERWKTRMSSGTAGIVSTSIKEITDQLPPGEIQQTAFDPATPVGGFAAVTANKSAPVRVAFRGTYRTVQRAFMDLEARLPQLQLQELRVTPGSSSQSLLNYQVSYTAWEQ
jgi:hypothetical protein